MAAEHVADKEVIPPISIDICKIDAHRVMAGAANCQLRRRPEMSVAIIDPDAVGSLKIVADINVRSAVAIQIAEHD